MAQYYVYRGVKYTKDGQKNTPVKNTRLEKIYRGLSYLKIRRETHQVCDHVYRGTHYMA